MVASAMPLSSSRAGARVRILLGAWRQRARLEYDWYRLKPTLAREAAPALQHLQEIKAALPPGRPLVGVLLAEHLGDIVAAEPVLRRLRRDQPAAHIVWFVKKAYAELVKDHPDVNDVVLLNSILESEVIVRSGFLDTAVDLHIVGKHCARHGLSYRKRWGDPTIDAKNYYLKGALLEALSLSAGLPQLDEQPRLHLGSEIRARVDARALPSPSIVFHAVSNEALRNWDPARWQALVARLHEAFAHTIVEVGLTPSLPDSTPGYLSLCGSLSVAETAEVIRRSALFIGIDSGPAHFANAFEIPSVILLGQYHAFGDYMPYTGHLRRHAERMILRSPGPCSELPVDAVFARVSALLRTGAGVSR